MDEQYEKRLEEVIDRKLKRLGDRQAPATLAPRVLQAIQKQSSAAWHRKPFQNWPRQAQALFICLGLALLGAVLYGVYAADTAVQFTQQAKASSQEIVQDAGTAYSFAQTIVQAFVLTLSRLPLMWMAVLAAAVMLMSASFVATGAAFVRLVFPQVRLNQISS